MKADTTSTPWTPRGLTGWLLLPALVLQHPGLLGPLGADAPLAVAETVATPARRTPDLARGRAQLALAKTADLPEVRVGETVLYTLTVMNTGTSSIPDVWIHDQLPAGTRLVEASVLGTDTVVVEGTELSLGAGATLAAGAVRTIRYALAVVSATNDAIANRAYATAQQLSLRSEEAVAWVRVRQPAPTEASVIFGRIWVDLDHNGIRDAGEPGGAQDLAVGADDGGLVPTDSEGAFAFRNRPSDTNAIRLISSSRPASRGIPDTASGDSSGASEDDAPATATVNFQIVPAARSANGTPTPYTARFSARRLCESVRRQFPEDQPIVVAHFADGSIEPSFLIDPTRDRARLRAAMSASAACRVEIAGHTDVLPTPRSAADDLRISETRARAVLQHLRRHGLVGPYATIRGHGSREPIATGTDVLARQLNRRVELRLVDPPYVEYRLEISNHSDQPLRGIAANFEPAADSAVVTNGGTLLTRSPVGTVTLPSIPPHTRLLVRAWALATSDSATVLLDLGSPADRDPVAPVK